MFCTYTAVPTGDRASLTKTITKCGDRMEMPTLLRSKPSNRFFLFLLLTLCLSNQAFAISVTISQRSLTLSPSQAAGEIRLLSGQEALEYEVKLLSQPNTANILWSPKRLTVPPASSVPVRFAYNPRTFSAAGTHIYTFQIRVRKAVNTGPLSRLGPSESRRDLDSNQASAQVALEPALNFRVYVQNDDSE